MNSLQLQYGYDAAFVSETPEYIRCTVCQLVLRDPIQILKCGHRFCAPCFNRLKEYSLQMRSELLCPIDRDVIDLDKVCADPGLRRAVSNLAIKCSNWELGCSWQGELSDLDQHDSRCQHRPPVVHSTSPQEHQDLVATVDDLRDRMNTFERESEKKEKENTYLKDCFQELKKQYKDLALKIANIEIDLESSKKKNSELEKVNAHMQVEFDLCKEKNAALENDVNRLKEKNSLLEKEAKEVRKKLTLSGEESTKPKEPMMKIENGKGSVLGAESVTARTEELQRKITLTHFKCPIKDAHISPDNIVHFSNAKYSTLVASDAMVPPGSKAFFEVTIMKHGEYGGCRLGWVDSDFLSFAESDILGNCCNSYGFNPGFQRKRHNGNSIEWGPPKNKTGGQVVGTVIDTLRGEIRYGIDGCWDAPLGVAFESIKKYVLHYPAVAGLGGTSVFVNFGQVDFMYGPPDASYSYLSLLG